MSKMDKYNMIDIDKDRERKRQIVIKKSLANGKEARKLLQHAGIITRQGNLAAVYRPKP